MACLALLFCLGCSSLLGAGLVAGAAKLTITPDPKTMTVYMAGFGNNRVATGVHDDLWVRCVALGAGTAKLAMCEADLIGLFYDDVLKVRGQVKAEIPDVTGVMVASSHVHEGPDTMGLWGHTQLESGIDPKYMDWLDDRIATAAVNALRSMKPAQLALGRNDDPSLALLQDDSRPPYVKDPHLLVIRIDSADSGEPIATAVNWSDHPETLGGNNTLITADYPHWLCQYIEDHHGGTAVFFEGSIGGLLSTLGDQVALLDPETGEVAKDETWKKAELCGTMLGDLAMRTAASAREAPVEEIVLRQAVIYSPLENDGFRVGGALGVFQGRKPLYTDGKPDPAAIERDIPGLGKVKYATGHDLQMEVDYIQLRGGGKLLAEIATVPGEIYPELVNGGITRYPGADYPDSPFEPTLRDHMHSPYPFVFGLANDEIGYIIPKAEWDSKPPWLQNRKEQWYGEVNSSGPEAAGRITRALVELMEEK
jgi:hypothetical protein